MHEVRTIGSCTLIRGDSADVLAEVVEPGSISAVVTDPPYGLSREPDMAAVLEAWISGEDYVHGSKGFMGREWDSFVPGPALWAEVASVMKPGAHLLAFASARTYDLMAVAIRLAAFEIRDQVMWLYGSGFPKNYDVAKGIDASDAKAEVPEDIYKFTAWLRSTGITPRQINEATGTQMASHYLSSKSQPAVPTADAFEAMRPYIPGRVPQWVERAVQDRTRRVRARSENLARREVVGQHDKRAQAARWREDYGGGAAAPAGAITTAYTAEARAWEGWGTALKPAHEPIVLARKPFPGTIVGNVLAHGTGAIDIDSARIAYADGTDYAAAAAAAARVLRDTPGRERWSGQGDSGYSDPAGSLAGWQQKSEMGRWPTNVIHDGSLEVAAAFPPEEREAMRFFYAAKAGRDEREFGLAQREGTRRAGTYGDGIGRSPKVAGERPTKRANIHPTVKPIRLMSYLVRLITPPSGRVLDPFMGSGSTGMACALDGRPFVGIERDPEYYEIACARIAAAVQDPLALGRTVRAPVHVATRRPRGPITADQAATIAASVVRQMEMF